MPTTEPSTYGSDKYDDELYKILKNDSETDFKNICMIIADRMGRKFPNRKQRTYLAIHARIKNEFKINVSKLRKELQQ